MKKYFFTILLLLLSFFFIAYVLKSVTLMVNVPFNEFDEAHRAENARQMKEYGSFVPLSGSPFDRNLELRIPIKNTLNAFLYYHLERPPLVYLLMVLSISQFGSVEWAYRLPSFLLGLSSFLVFIYFAKKFSQGRYGMALVIGLLALMTSTDLWLSSQYAQLDTGLSTFLFLALLSLIYYCEVKKKLYLFLSSIGLSLAILSKGQPAIIFIFPLIFLLWAKRIKIKEVIMLLAVSSALLSPWIAYTVFKFGIVNGIKIFLGFAFSSAIGEEIHHYAPTFWYLRWWLETFLLGLSLFIALFITDTIQKLLDWKKITLLFYIWGSLIVFSIPQNKLWWYVLPLIPAVCFYIYLSLLDLQKIRKNLIFDLAVVIALVATPFLFGVSQRTAILLGVFLAAFFVYLLNYSSKSFSHAKAVFLLAIILSLVSFYARFPQIIPYHWDIKPVALYFSNLPAPKCLWVYDLPLESALFYSQAGEIGVFNRDTALPGHCYHYLITPADINQLTANNIQEKKLIFQQNEMKLFAIR